MTLITDESHFMDLCYFKLSSVDMVTVGVKVHLARGCPGACPGFALQMEQSEALITLLEWWSMRRASRVTTGSVKMSSRVERGGSHV